MDKHLIELAAKAISGDKEAAGQLIELKFKDILYFAMSQTNRQEAEEIAQNVVLHIYQSIQNLRQADKFNAWLMSIVYHECLNHMKKIRKSSRRISDIPFEEYENIISDDMEFLPEEYAVNKENRESLIKYMEQFPKHYANCLTMYYLEGLSRDEIAEVLGVNIKKVYNDLHRGRTLLKKRIEKETGKSLVYGITPVGAIPVLTRILQADLESKVSQQWCDQVMADIQPKLTELDTGAAGQVIKTSGSLTVKIFAGTAIVGLVTAGLILINRPQEEVQPPAVVTTETMVVETEILPESTEKRIETLSDMIGEDEARRLSAYADGQVTGAEWNEFIARIGAVEETVSAEPDNTYISYLLYKPDKRLLLAERRGIEGDLEIIYLFEDASADLPKMIQIILMFDN